MYRRRSRSFIVGGVAALLLVAPALVQVMHGGGSLVVTTTADGVPGSLRAEILLANTGTACAAPCTISFSAPGTYVVDATVGPLPAITQPSVTIDGSMPGFSANTNTFGQPDNAVLKVAIVANAPFIDGLTFNAGGAGVRNVAIGGFSRAIVLNSSATISGNFIGTNTSGNVAVPNSTGIALNAANFVDIGATDADRNVISGNGIGIDIGSSSLNVHVDGNYIGTSANLTSALPKQTTGVQIGATFGNVVVGLSGGIGNLISGNATGISVGNGAAGAVDFFNNRIGVNAAGTGPYVVSQTNGIVASSPVMIGDSGGISPNVISGNTGDAIQLSASSQAYFNFIGTDITGAVSVPNGGNGIRITGNSNTVIANTIRFNHANGVLVDTGRSNAITGNVIAQNVSMGIDLVAGLIGVGPTPNDPGDADTGGNGFQNFPTINSAQYNGSVLELDVSIDSSLAPGTQAFIFEVFKADTSSNPQALEVLGASGCWAGDPLNNASFFVGSGSVHFGDKIVMTATSYSDVNCINVNDGTSEFSFPATTVTLRPGWVINTNDSGIGSLRQAILDSNATGDAVQFAIPPSFATGNVFIIKPLSPLPALTVGTVVDGSSQRFIYGDTNPAGPEIVINGSLAGPAADGLVLSGPVASGAFMQELVINGFSGNGITVDGENGVNIRTMYIGVDATASAIVPNGGHGIAFVNGSSNGVIGSFFGQGNVIGGNRGDGVFIGPLSDSDFVFNNVIGTDQTGTRSLPNLLNGVEVNDGSSNTIGGFFFGAIRGPIAKTHKLKKGTEEIPNSGPNIIAFNGRNGVVIKGAAALGNPISSNSIFSNGLLGIDLGDDGVTPNDPLDADTGPNDLQNYPVLSAVTTTEIDGTLNSEPNTTFHLEFFSNTVADPSGFGEGQQFLGTQSVTTDALGNATFQFFGTFTPGRFISSTATKVDPITSAQSTSEFSRDLVVGGIATPPNADLSIVKRGPSTFPTSGTITFIIIVRNNGPDDALNVVVSDPTPKGLTFVANSGDCTTAFPCNFASIPVGQTRTITSRYSLTAGTTAVRNTASVSASSPDLNTANNSSTVTVSGNVCPTDAPSIVSPIPNSTGLPTSGTILWTNVGGDSHDVYIGPVGTGCSTLVAKGIVGTSFAYSGLQPGVAYEARVVANKTGCPSLSSQCIRFTVCGAPDAPLAGVHGAPTSGRPYFLIWNSTGDHYIAEEATDETFTNSIKFPTTGTSMTFVHDLLGGLNASVFFYRVQAFGSCTTMGSAYSKTVRVVVLPQKNGIINVPAGTKEPVVVQVFVPGDPSGPQTFTALLDKPWLLKVAPPSGTLATTGQTFDVTIDPAQLPNGTFTGTLTLLLTSPSSGRLIVNGSGSKAVPVTINLVTPFFPADVKGPTPDTLIILAVGHLIGVNSQWQSNIRVFNNSNQSQQYQLDFLTSQATDSRQTTVQTAAGDTTALDDIIHNWFGFGEVGDSAAGILEIRAVSSSSSSNPLATLVSSQTFNLSNSLGTVGEFIPGILFKNFIGKAANAGVAPVLSLQQISQTASSRSNISLVEASGSPASVLLSIFNSAGTKLFDLPVNLNSGEQRTLGSLLAQQGISASDARVEVRVTSGEGKVSAYASVVDSNSLDPMLVPPTILGQTTAQKYVLPGVADLNNGLAIWRTDMRILNGGDSPQTANLLFYPEGKSDSPLAATLTINPKEVKVLDSVLASLFSATNVGGAVHVTTAGDSQFVVSGRTFDQTSNGTVGQFITAATPADAVDRNGRALNILQVEDSVRYRTNAGLAEMSGKPATVEISVILPDSKVTPSIQVQLAANEFRQFAVGQFGLGNIYDARLNVHVISGAGSVTAYGSVIDMKTGDATYMPSQ